MAGRVITGAVLGNQIGAPAAIDPVHLDGIRRGQADLVVRAGNFDECPTDCVGGQRFQRGGDGGDRRFVTRQQMPVGGWVGGVRAAGAHQVDRLPTLGPSRPRTGYPVLTVQHDVHGDLAGRGVDMTNGHGAHRRPLRGGQVGEAVQGQRPGQPPDIDIVVDEHQLDVRVGEVAGDECVEAAAAEHYPDHVRREVSGSDNLKGVQWSTRHMSSCPDPTRVDYTSRAAAPLAAA